MTLFGLLSPFVKKTIQFMKKYFEVKDFDSMTRLLDIHIQYEKDEIVLSQRCYIENILKIFKMNMSRSVSTQLNNLVKLMMRTIEEQPNNPTNYELIMRSLISTDTETRVDLIYTKTLLSQYFICPNETHLNVPKNSLWYLNKTKD